MIVVDASVIVTALADDGADGDRARQRLAGERRLVAPHLLDIEVVSASRRLAEAGDMDERRAEFALDDLRSLRVDRVPYLRLVGRCWELRHTLSAYDAAYVALAEAMELALVTLDDRLSTASGPRCPIEVLT